MNQSLIDTICDHLSHRIINGELANNDLVQIIEHVGGYLNLATISNYAKANDLSYNGAKKFRDVVVIFDTKFIIDNQWPMRRFLITSPKFIGKIEAIAMQWLIGYTEKIVVIVFWVTYSYTLLYKKHIL